MSTRVRWPQADQNRDSRIVAHIRHGHREPQLPGCHRLALMLIVAATWVVSGCSGDEAIVVPDTGARLDGSRDHSGAVDRGALDEGGSRDAVGLDTLGSDGQLAADSATPSGCKQYSAWTCTPQQGAMLCKTRCGDDELVCTNGGTCQCGIGAGPCKGTYSGATPCDVCRAAWLAGCCK